VEGTLEPASEDDSSWPKADIQSIVAQTDERMKAIKPRVNIQFDCSRTQPTLFSTPSSCWLGRDIANDRRRMKQSIMAVAHGVKLSSY
jgi:hypothetical protein